MRYLVEIEISAYKTLQVEALDLEDAMTRAEDICQNTVIPVGPEDILDINVTDVYDDFTDNKTKEYYDGKKN